MISRSAICLGIAVAGIAIAALMAPISSRRASAKRFQIGSDNRVESLSVMALRYAAENKGRFPSRLSELLVYYGDGDTLEMFYAPPYEGSSSQWLPPGWRVNHSLIDICSSYRLWPSPNPENCLIFEMPGLWNDESVSVGFVARPGSNIAKEPTNADVIVKRLTKSQFAELIEVKQKLAR